MAAIDMSNNIGSGFQNHIGVNQARAGDRRPAGVNGGLNAIFAGPVHHLPRGFAVLDGPQPHFAHQGHARIGEVLEVLLLHPVFDDRRARMNLDAGGPEILVPTLRGNRHGLEADHILGPPGHMHLARRDQRCHPAVQGAVDPMQLLLSGRVIADDRVNMAVDQSRRQRDPLGIDNGVRPVAIQIAFLTPLRDFTVDCDQAVGVQNGVFHLARQHLSNVLDDELLRHGILGSLVEYLVSMLIDIFFRQACDVAA